MDQHFLTPEEIAAQIIGPDVAMQQSEIEHQRALANALRQPGPQHTTGTGAMFGAVASAINGYQSGKNETEAKAAAQKLSADELERARAYWRLLHPEGAMAPGAAQQMAQADVLRRPRPMGDATPMDSEGGAY